MFIVSRVSESGGQEYLVKGIRRLRWDKVAKTDARRYRSASGARRQAINNDAKVSKLSRRRVSKAKR
jgi:hypothetical protein